MLKWLWPPFKRSRRFKAGGDDPAAGRSVCMETRGTTPIPCARRCGRWGFDRRSPGGAPKTAWGSTAGWSNGPSVGSTNSGASEFAMSDSLRYIWRSFIWAVPSSAGASSSSGCEMSSKHPCGIRWKYKGRIYKAQVRRDGRIHFQGKTFTSPSVAAAGVARHAVDGWYAWKYERAPGDWVELNELRN